jgi:hypothetical protein
MFAVQTKHKILGPCFIQFRFIEFSFSMPCLLHSVDYRLVLAARIEILLRNLLK